MHTTPHPCPLPRRGLHGVLAGVVALVVLASCGEGGSSKAEKAAAKEQRDTLLRSLPYPPPPAALPKSIDTQYDATSNRTKTTLTLRSLNPAPGTSPRVSSTSLVLTLTSSHKGKARAAGDVEGSVDGALTAASAAQGALAFAGSPGTIIADGTELVLKDASGGPAYQSTPASGGYEETIRFRIATEHLVTAANAQNIRFRFAGVELECTALQVSDLRAFASTLQPTP